MTSKELRKYSRWERKYGYLNKENIHGSSQKIKDMRYGPFDILEKVGDNSYKHDLPPYLHIYSLVNGENLKLYEPSMLYQVLE